MGIPSKRILNSHQVMDDIFHLVIGNLYLFVLSIARIPEHTLHIDLYHNNSAMILLSSISFMHISKPLKFVPFNKLKGET
jgi:hypothetical protein